MIQLCLERKMTACSLNEALASAMSFIMRKASSDEIRIGSTQTKPAFCSQILFGVASGIVIRLASPPNQPKMPTEMTSGTMNCTAETPRLPSPALRPSAEPLRSFGKKKLMLAMLELKLPPPKPQNAASTSITQYGVPGYCTAIPMPTAGISSDNVDITVQRRPPTIGTMNE